ncbi:heat shock protein, Hsp 20 family protein [Nitzschia inconspicua]|uniref:Heat shock protein, Hsp 20 family protein n=1 Tax=Nitzschia inconspicua TaxID=303405 RepID=A0A9K3LH44_9STRA|nr:heat shock protein, Hsp 20 family protein [Nitzschia inconspicua]
MKLEAISLAAVLAVTVTDAYMYNSVPGNCRPPPSSSFRNSDTFSSSPRSDRYKQRQERIDQAFCDMQNEMNETVRRRRQQQQRGSNPTMGQFDFMMMDPFSVNYQDVDKKAVKKWVDKAFDLAAEFNQDFSRTSQEREKNDEILQKSREWVENMYQTNDETAEEGKISDADLTSPSSMEDKDDGTLSSEMKSPVMNIDSIDASSEQPEESEVLTPYSENRSDAEIFLVTVDLPGVQREDVDLTLERDFLVVQAQRRPREDYAAQTVRNYVKKFAVVEDEIPLDKIEASLINGVLTVSAPKKKPEEKKDTKIKIPLS